MVEKNKEVVARLEEIGVVPVIKLDETENAVQLAKALADGGINCAEVTFRAKGADKVIAEMVKAYPQMMIGAGTVLTIEQAESAIAAGAKFVVAPGLNVKVAKFVLDKGVPFIPGVSSASEIEQAMELGIKHVKFFPAEQAGGLAYIKAISAPYSDIRFMPTGGINENNIVEYLANDKIFACGGSFMVAPELVKAQKWAEITALCKAAMGKILGFELGHVGLNSENETQAIATASSFNAAFGFENKVGASSIFSGSGIEVMKGKYFGASGHIAIKTNSILRAMHALKTRGFDIDMTSAKYDDKNKLAAVYLKNEFGGFAVHLLQKK